MALELKVKEGNEQDIFEDPRIKGNLLDMWGLYRELSPNPSKLPELTVYNYLDKRDGLLFPDFFNAVRTLIRNNSSNGQNLEDELDKTFRTMHAKWDVYGSFFEQHPELRYLRPQRFESLTHEFEQQFPFLRSVDISLVWSLKQYHSLQGNLDIYTSLDEELAKKPAIGTFFERDGRNDFGEVFVYLRPYGKAAEEISEYLRLLKHGDLIGFGSIAIAYTEGKRFVAVTALQTDLLRKDHVDGIRSDSRSMFTGPEIKRNEDDKCTVPGYLRKPYLSGYAWAHRIVGAVEAAAVKLSEKVPVDGVIIPLLSTAVTVDGIPIRDGKDLFKSDYAKGLYEVFPKERGYTQQNISPNFPLTNKLGEGKWWMAPIEDLRAHKSDR